MSIWPYPQPCTRCERLVEPDRIVWLELRTSDNAWLLPGVMEPSDPDNQGGFAFGADCAQYALTHEQDW